MQDAALFFRSRALASFHRRRKYALLSPEWRHEVKEARQFIRYCRANWDDRPREITRTHYALGPLMQMQKPLTRPEELSAVILHMLRQDCAQNSDRDKLDTGPSAPMKARSSRLPKTGMWNSTAKAASARP